MIDQIVTYIVTATRCDEGWQRSLRRIKELRIESLHPQDEEEEVPAEAVFLLALEVAHKLILEGFPAPHSLYSEERSIVFRYSDGIETREFEVEFNRVTQNDYSKEGVLTSRVVQTVDSPPSEDPSYVSPSNHPSYGSSITADGLHQEIDLEYKAA